jgi:hypothetical protein
MHRSQFAQNRLARQLVPPKFWVVRYNKITFDLGQTTVSGVNITEIYVDGVFVTSGEIFDRGLTAGLRRAGGSMAARPEGRP